MRPTFVTLSSGFEGWDADYSANLGIFKDGPWPVYEHTGDQTDLQSTFAAASFDRCLVAVNHTTLGWALYASDGTAWNIQSLIGATALVALTDSTGGTANDTVVAVPAVNGSGATTAQEAAIDDNFADLAAKVNELRDLLVDNGRAS